MGKDECVPEPQMPVWVMAMSTSSSVQGLGVKGCQTMLPFMAEGSWATQPSNLGSEVIAAAVLWSGYDVLWVYEQRGGLDSCVCGYIDRLGMEMGGDTGDFILEQTLQIYIDLPCALSRCAR